MSTFSWPELSWSDWEDTATTLHMFMQIVGKTRTALTPTQNHWWNVPLYITARGLSTSAMPIAANAVMDIEFDFVSHELVFRRSSGKMARLALRPQSVSSFFQEYMETLRALGLNLEIERKPVEVKDPIPFDQDKTHCSYDREQVGRFWQVLILADMLLKRFSTNFYGKISPVHFFWGSFDLAVTRFSGRRAPARPESDSIQAEAYSHEVISAGFWPGNGGYGQAAFYCYAAPVPVGLSEVKLTSQGGFNAELGEFVLDYEEVRKSAEPARTILDFLHNTYSVAADLARWDRLSLDRHDKIADAAVRSSAS